MRSKHLRMWPVYVGIWLLVMLVGSIFIKDVDATYRLLFYIGFGIFLPIYMLLNVLWGMTGEKRRLEPHVLKLGSLVIDVLVITVMVAVYLLLF